MSGTWRLPPRAHRRCNVPAWRRVLLTAVMMWAAPLLPPTHGKLLVRMGYFEEAMPWAVACVRGWMDTDDIEVGCYPQSSGGYAVSRLDVGDLDFGQLGSTPNAVAFSRGVDLVAYQLAHGHGNSQGLAVRGGGGPHTLIGKTLATPFGSTAHYHLIYFIHILGLPLCPASQPHSSCISVINKSPAGLMAAYDANEIDGAFVWGQGFVHLRAEGAIVVVDSDALKRWGEETLITMVVRTEFARQHPAFMQRVAQIKLLLDQTWLESDPRWSTTDSTNTSFLAAAGALLSLPMATLVERIALHKLISEREFVGASGQLSCAYLGHNCSTNGLGNTIRLTSEFFMRQKFLATLTPRGKWAGNHSFSTPAAAALHDYAHFQGLIDASISLNGVQLDEQSLNLTALPTTAYQGSTDSGACNGWQNWSVSTHTGNLTDRGTVPLARAASYRDSQHCMWEIPPATPGQNQLVQVEFWRFRVWSGDTVRVFDGSNTSTSNNQPTGTLLGQLTGIDRTWPVLRSRSSMLIEFTTDSNPESCFNKPQGDGWALSYNRAVSGCVDSAGCGNGTCNSDGTCTCTPGRGGADCSLQSCLGTHVLTTSNGIFKSAPDALQFGHLADNSLDCIFEVDLSQQLHSYSHVIFQISLDAEETFDWLRVRQGSGESAVVTTELTGFGAHNVSVPLAAGKASLHFITDSRGRRSGFSAVFQAHNATGADCAHASDCSGPDHGICVHGKCECETGWFGLSCASPTCVSSPVNTGYDHTSQLSGRFTTNLAASPTSGSATAGYSVPVMADCTWIITSTGLSSTRLLFEVFDLEPDSAGDFLSIADSNGNLLHKLHVQTCTPNTGCTKLWQSGICRNGTCAIRNVLHLAASSLVVKFQTDRNDVNVVHKGINATWNSVVDCPIEGQAQQITTDGTSISCIGAPGSCDCLMNGGTCSHGHCICANSSHCSCGCGGSLTYACAIDKVPGPSDSCVSCPAGSKPAADGQSCMLCSDIEQTMLYSASGLSCLPCPPGSEPVLNRTSCVACPHNTFSTNGVCRQCSAGRFSSNGSLACSSCPVGRTGLQAGQGCTHCQPGFYGLVVNGSCTSCTDLEVLNEQRLKVDFHMSSLQQACPGGVPGISAGICPIDGLYNYKHLNNIHVELLPCEIPSACVSSPQCSTLSLQFNPQADASNTTWFSQRGLVSSSTCSKGHGGFLCAQCVDGFTKIMGVCKECDGFQLETFIFSMLSSFFLSLFLLHKSTGSQPASEEELLLMWYKIDTKRLGRLSGADVLKVLQMSGIPVDGIDTQKLLQNDYGCADLDQTLGINDFVRVRLASMPSNVFGTLVFYCQTLALLAKDTGGAMSIVNLLNMDFEHTTDSCVGNLSYMQRFVFTVLTPPVLLLSFIPLCELVWNFLRVQMPDWLISYLFLPPRILPIHKRRAVVYIFLFVFAPITRKAMECLVWVTTCTDDSQKECQPVMAFDQGLRYMHGETIATFVLALAVVLTASVVIPAILVIKLKHECLRRENAFSADPNAAEFIFVNIMQEAPEQAPQLREREQRVPRERSASGVPLEAPRLPPLKGVSSPRRARRAMAGGLDGRTCSIRIDQIPRLLDMLSADGHHTGKQAEQAFYDMDEDKNGVVDYNEFKLWYTQWVQTIPETALDVLFAPYRPAVRWWWFNFMLYLKLTINFLFTFGYFSVDEPMLLWMHLLLIPAIVLLRVKDPNLNQPEQTVELVSLVCLAGLSHIGTEVLYQEVWSMRDVAAIVLIGAVPIILSTGALVRAEHEKHRLAKEISDRLGASKLAHTLLVDGVPDLPNAEAELTHIFKRFGKVSNTVVVPRYNRETSEDETWATVTMDDTLSFRQALQSDIGEDDWLDPKRPLKISKFDAKLALRTTGKLAMARKQTLARIKSKQARIRWRGGKKVAANIAKVAATPRVAVLQEGHLSSSS